MSAKLKMMIVLLMVCIGVFVTANCAVAAKPLAKVTGFKGEVSILSGAQFTDITQKGAILNEGDRIQTRNGEAEVTFDDGAIMKLSPFTSTMIQEREEESGWLFKTKTTARRLTVFVGKLWFSSGSSHKKNILQTPSAVCGLRGSESEIGYDNVKSFLNTISGGSDTIGEFIKGVFENPGVDAALKSSVYQAMITAQNNYNQAKQSGAPLDQANAEMAGLQAVKAAAEALKNSPDAAVAALANQALNQTNTLIQEKQNQIQQIPTTVAPPTTVKEMTTTRAEQTTTRGLPVLPTRSPLPPTTTRPPTTTSTTTTTTSSSPTTTSGVPVSPIGR